MKNCPRCNITFHLDDRSRCLYCNTLLLTSHDDKTDLTKKIDPGFLGTAAQPVIEKVVNEHGIEAHTRLSFIISSYFRTRSFHFMYAFSRNDFKMGPDFDRELIQPFHLTSLLALPWLVVNIFDSFVCRFVYTKYCPKCGWKFYRTQGSDQEHDHAECEYNREYKEVVDAILKGSIMKHEEDFRRLGLMKHHAGRRSAYWDLCRSDKFLTSFVDIAVIWLSICLWTILVVSLIFPSVIKGVYSLEI